MSTKTADAATNEPRITAEQFDELVRSTIPLAREMPFSVLALGWGTAVIRLGFHEGQLRAGGTLNGPTMMTLADTVLYAAVLTRVGFEPLAVTSDLNIRFLRRPEPRALVARATVLRAGKKLCVGTIEIASEGDVRGEMQPQLVAHATGTYALP
jgi:uncharacterized protein (TIGR00369 family)